MGTSADTTLQALLDDNARYALGARGTTNHCPMALVALARMGATPARLQAFHARWIERFAILEGDPVITVAADNWTAQRGESASFASLRDYFVAWIKQDGVNHVLQTVFGNMPPAPATGAFHALIRIAYGLEAAHAGEIAAGLAAYVVNNLPIPLVMRARAPAASVRAGFAQLAALMNNRDWPDGAITGRLRAVAADLAFQQVAPAPPQNAHLLDDIAEVAIHLYWQTRNFTVLHMVTGVNAARVAAACLSAEQAASLTDALWSSLCAAYVSVGAPTLVESQIPAASRDWPQLFAQAIQSDDDHVIKMVYTCFRESQSNASLPYRMVAERLLSTLKR